MRQHLRPNHTGVINNVGSPLLGDISQAAISQFGVDPSLVSDLITVERVARTRTRTSHGLTIRVAGGRIIGAIYGFTHNQTRQLDEEWEINIGARGAAPSDIVPQNVTERSLRINRYDLFTRNMEEVFNRTGEIATLSDQFRPFTLRTIWQSPVGIVLGGRRVYQYTGCWFRSIGRTARADDNRIINVDAELIYQDRVRLA